MQYKISIITPFHNIDMKVFDGTITALKNQTYGFENIEWVIVVHNSEDSYYNDVMERLGKCPNVIIDRIANKIHTPSSPRNRGLELATGQCVAFLDGDDKFREDAIEKIVDAYERTEAQVIVFRREYELEFPDMLALSETTAVNQAYEEIIVTKESGMDSRIYNDFPFFVTSRAYDLQFLRDKNITFDEDYEIAEDCYFNLATIGEADKICYMPQLIGYNYFINSGSMLSSAKSDEQILHMLSNVVGVMERALDYGIYANHIIICLGFVMSRYLAFPHVKMETRQKVKSVYEPYLMMTQPIPKGRFCEPFNSLMNTLPYEILLDVDRFATDRDDNGVPDGLNVLYGILENNKETDFGRRYHFADILSKKGYQYQVPLSKLSDYQGMIDLKMSIGETNILTNEHVVWYASALNGLLSQVTDGMVNELTKHFENMITGNKVLLWWEGSTAIRRRNDGIPVSSIYIISLVEYFKKRLYGGDDKAIFTSPMELILNSKEEDLFYLNLLLAVAEKDLDQIVVYNAWDYEPLLSTISKNWDTLISDIEKGTISVKTNLTEKQSKALTAYLHADPERAAELKKIKRTEDGIINLTDIWHKLNKISTTSIKTSDKKRVIRGIGNDSVVFENSGLLTGMGVIGKAAGNGSFELQAESIFYEFVEGDVGKTSKAKFLNEIQKDVTYSVAVTTGAGLYRCLLPFKITVTDIKDGKVYFK